MAKTILACALAASLCLFSHGAGAQTACAPHDDMVRHLAGRYSEKPVAIGVTSRGHLLEMLASPDGRTWSVLVTNPGGLACLVLEGIGFERVTVPIGDPS